MYSVQDLLISHGYKLAQNPPPSYERRYTDCHREIAGNRSGHGTANGYETDTGAFVHSRQAPAKGYSSDNECRKGNQRGKAGGSNQGDTQPSGDFLTTDSGFYDGIRGVYSQPRDEKDVAYWRRRGQDFSVLLDYADGRELRGGGFPKTERTRRAQEVAADNDPGNERQRWGAGLVPHPGDRKCQSLGTEEWRPAVGMGRQLSDGEGERWARNQRPTAPVDSAVHPRTKGKSQSLPRVLSPESLQHIDMPAPRQDSHRTNGDLSLGPNGKESRVALLPRPRFSRPLMPPSYEAHQQTRGSLEMLAGDQVSQPKDKSPLLSASGESLRQDGFAPEPAAGCNTEPPIYIPPPSYKRLPPPPPPPSCGEAQKSCGVVASFRPKGEQCRQVAGSREAGKWFSRQSGSSWLEHQKSGSAPGRKQVRPGHTEEHLGWVQYIPFDDPRVRHVSGGLRGSSLTDSEKIRNVNNEPPSAKVFEQSSHDSAFLPPQGLFVSMRANKGSLNEHDNGNRWYSGLHTRSDNSLTFDQSCNKFRKDRPFTAFQTRSSSQNANLNQAFSETVTQIKKIEPGVEAENKKNSKRKVNETIFCLVSVPIILQSNGESLNPKNNERVPNPADGGSIENTTGCVQNQSLLSTSSTDMELQVLTGGVVNVKGRKRAPPRKESADTQSLRTNRHQELCYTGSWPGDQYRDQETQTSSPEVSRGPLQGPAGQQAQDTGRAASDTTTDSGIGTDCSNRYGYPMTGQKSLNPSSNSAFSWTANFSSQLNKSTSHTPRPSGNHEEVDYPSARKGETKPAIGQEAFGQFLLKPVSRRPWDAIEELESLNKELQEQFGKRPSVDQCIEDLDEAYRDILELSTIGSNVESIPMQILGNKKQTTGLNEESLLANKTVSAFDHCWTTAADPRASCVDHRRESKEVRSAFSRPAGKAGFGQRLREQEAQTLSEAGDNDSWPSRSDITVPRESLLRDVGLTVYTEAPGAPRQPVQDASTLTSPPDYEDVCYALQLSRERATSAEYKLGNLTAEPEKSTHAQDMASSWEVCSKTDAEGKAKKESLVPKFGGEKSSYTPMATRQGDWFYNRGGPLRGVGGRSTVGKDASSDAAIDPDDHFDWRKQLSLAEKHLESLLLKEKANTLPAEDLSNLYEVKCAEGIPENESIEERAARILGIDVPAESLGVVDHRARTSECTIQRAPEYADGKVPQVRRQYAEVSELSVLPNGQVREEEEAAGPRRDRTGDTEQGTREQVNHVAVCPEPSEFPTDKPLLWGGSELKGHMGCQTTAALQGDRDSMSRTGGLSAKRSDSWEKAEANPEGSPAREEPQPGGPVAPPTQLRNGTVAKREITLPLGFSVTSRRVELLDDEAQLLSDSYDPSRVERV